MTPPGGAVHVRLSVMSPVMMLDAEVGTSTCASSSDAAGVAGATGEAAGVPVMMSTSQSDEELPRSLTRATTMSMRGWLPSAVATVRAVLHHRAEQVDPVALGGMGDGAVTRVDLDLHSGPGDHLHGRGQAGDDAAERGDRPGGAGVGDPACRP